MPPSLATARAPLALALAAAVAWGGCRGDDKPAGGGTKPKVTGAKPAPTGSGVVRGHVSFSGAVPAPKEWGGRDFVGCKSLRPAELQLVRVQGGKLADAFVWVKAGLPEGGYPAPSEPVHVDQKGCEFVPRVFGAMAEQPVLWTNGDQFMHNVNSGQFNQGLATAGVTFTKGLEEPAAAGPITVRCDVHPWMRAYAWVLPHPYFKTTGDDGAFEIGGLVDGDLTIGVWHEVLGTQEKTVKVTAATTAVVDFEMKAP